MIEYELLKQQRYDSVYGLYDTYGVCVTENGRIIREIGDISLDREKTSALIGSFNTEHLSPDHLDDCIEDFLYDFSL